MVDETSGLGEHRGAPRSAFILAASIEAGGATSPVRIRNLSETGALLEGGAFPSVGTLLVLTRQELEIAAEVVWHDPPRCGVRFRGRISVADWVVGKSAGPAFGQSRVDAIQAAVRSGADIPGAPSPPIEADQGPQDLNHRVAQEIAGVQSLLEATSAQLIGDPAVVEQHGTVLQNFDVADQILGHLRRIIASPDPVAAIRSVGMEELRVRLARRDRPER